MNMNGNKLLDKISDLDPKLIADAEKKPHRSKRALFVGLTSGMATVAAAAVIAVTAANMRVQTPPVVTSDPVVSGSNSGSTSTQDPPVIDNTPKDPPELDFSKYKDLPKIMDKDYSHTAMGGGEKMLLSKAELDITSPWKGAELETMPVYMSSSTDADLDQMCAYIKRAAAAMGISESDLEFNYWDFPVDGWDRQLRKSMEDAGLTEEEIEKELDRIRRINMGNSYIEARADGITFSLDTSFSLAIIFDEPVELPDGYGFTDGAIKIFDYLAEQYSGLIEYGKPAPGGSYEFSVYDSDGDITQQTVNYWTNYVRFLDKQGKLDEIRIKSLTGCEKLADYPILTPDQAVEILKSNKYNDEERMPADAKILKTDIVYKNSMGATAVIPCYKFYIETDEDPGFYDIACKVYTIPAVPEEFIDMETENYGVSA